MRLSDHIDLNTIVNTLGLKGKMNGKKFFTNCLFHNDKNPSFNIYRYDSDGQFYYKCFSCGEKGHVNNLFKKVLGKSIYKHFNLEQNVEKYLFSIDVDKGINKSNNSDCECTNKKSSLQIKGNLSNIYDNNRAINYLLNRNVSKKFINYFNFQFSKYTDINGTKFYNRIIIPIYDIDKKLVSVEGRIYSKEDIEKAKSNSLIKKALYPADAYFKQSLFNIHNINFDEDLYVSEGILDLNIVFDLGYRNIGSLCGNQISAGQIKLLNKCKKRLIILSDNDEGGETLISKLDKELDREFYIVKSKVADQDPGAMTHDQTEQAISTMKISVEYLIDKYELFKEAPSITW